jgi:NTP pyrophosphatase (non-canonical NTP hydrolase)|tara:strand:- start:2004 stop:2831 length:828 start_codon:yes stop_codon:yes gene_type:complete
MDKKIEYYLYHIPGKKIGVTRNLISRVVEQQGYNLDEIEVLDQSSDIDYISDRELELQQSYGYRVDRQKYKDLYINKIKLNKMKINATEQTSTFPIPLSKLKGRLMDELGREWETLYGKFQVSKDTVEWLVNNAKTSMYDANRCYIYNKAFFEKFVNAKKNDYNEYLQQKFNQHAQDNEDRFDKIRTWASDRGLYDKGDTKTQFAKLMEESGELARAVLKDDKLEFVDAIGDMVVVLTNLAYLGGTNIEHCIDSAYEVIRKRSGNMVNGTFVKND